MTILAFISLYKSLKTRLFLYKQFSVVEVSTRDYLAEPEFKESTLHQFGQFKVVNWSKLQVSKSV